MAKLSFRDHSEFQAAHKRAKEAATYECGMLWKLVPGASVLARLPAKWITCKVGVMPAVNRRAGKALRVAKSPRDVRLPAACFWDDGELPAGPDYVEDYARDSGAEPLTARHESSDFRFWNDNLQLAEAAD